MTVIKIEENLNKDLSKGTFSGLFVVNIYELYDMQGDNQVLQEIEKFLKNFAQNRFYEVYRIYNDQFVLRNKAAGIVYATIEQDMEELFKTPLNIIVGISLEKDKALKKAEIALSYAKKNNMQYIAYSKFIDTTNIFQEVS